MAKGYYISEGDLPYFRRAIEQHKHTTYVVPELDEQIPESEVHWVEITSDLSAPSDALNPTTVTAEVFELDSSGTLTGTGEDLEVTNRFPDFEITASSSDPMYVLVYLHEDEYLPLNAGSGGGGGGGGGCTVQCDSIDIEDATIQHPELPAGAQSTTNVWQLEDACGDSLPAITVESSDGNGTITWPGGAPELEYDSADDIFKLDISSQCTAADNSGTDVTSSSTITASIEMDWSVDPATVTFDIDGTLP